MYEDHVRETEEVSKAHGGTHGGEDELRGASPPRSLDDGFRARRRTVRVHVQLRGLGTDDDARGARLGVVEQRRPAPIERHVFDGGRRRLARGRELRGVRRNAGLVTGFDVAEARGP